MSERSDRRDERGASHRREADAAHRFAWMVWVASGILVLAACSVRGARHLGQHRWWAGLGPVIPHDSFPADCNLCHVGDSWQELVPTFSFDHETETGVALVGAHSQAQCLRCHNDRGPVAVFQERGCAGCHEDRHQGTLGNDCASCHQETTWRPFGQVELHARTRFPLYGVHAETSCRRCHIGAEVGRFMPTDTACVTCHRDDLLRATNPNHVNLGLVRRCDRCHQPTTWTGAVLND